MPKLKYDTSDVDPEARSFETPKPGVYRGKVNAMEVGQAKSGSDMLTVQFEIVLGEYKGSRLWERIVLAESSKWKLDQFLQAVKLTDGKRRKGTLDTDRPQALPEVLLRVKNEQYEGDTVARITAMLPFNDPEEEAPFEEDEEAEEEDEATDYNLLSLAALRALAKERGLETDGLKKAGLVELLTLDDEEDEDREEDPEDEPDEEEDEEEVEANDYAMWDLADIKAELEDRGLKSTGPKSALVKRLNESDDEDPFAD